MSTRRFLYFVADSATVPPTGGGDRAARLGVDPGKVLARLVATVEGVPATAPAHAASEPVADGVWAVTESAVLALCGADGDPEMEWDDAVAQWAAHPDVADALAGLGEDELLDLTDRLRALCGGLGPSERLFVTERAH